MTSHQNVSRDGDEMQNLTLNFMTVQIDIFFRHLCRNLNAMDRFVDVAVDFLTSFKSINFKSTLHQQCHSELLLYCQWLDGEKKGKDSKWQSDYRQMHKKLQIILGCDYICTAAVRINSIHSKSINPKIVRNRRGELIFTGIKPFCSWNYALEQLFRGM